MKKLIILICSLCIVLSFTGCDNTNDPEKIINVGCETHYINTTESWYVNSHNGYKAIEATEDYNEETDTYTVVIKFKKLLN